EVERPVIARKERELLNLPRRYAVVDDDLLIVTPVVDALVVVDALAVDLLGLIDREAFPVVRTCHVEVRAAAWRDDWRLEHRRPGVLLLLTRADLLLGRATDIGVETLGRRIGGRLASAVVPATVCAVGRRVEGLGGTVLAGYES